MDYNHKRNAPEHQKLCQTHQDNSARNQQQNGNTDERPETPTTTLLTSMITQPDCNQGDCPRHLPPFTWTENNHSRNLLCQSDNWEQQKVTKIDNLSNQENSSTNQTHCNHMTANGHDTQSPKPSNTTRLYYKNTNSIGTSAFTNRLTTLYQHHKEMDIDISFYMETNTDWQQPTTNNSMKHMVSQSTTTPSLHTLQGTPQLGSGTK
jgi:hypothetical protein